MYYDTVMGKFCLNSVVRHKFRKVKLICHCWLELSNCSVDSNIKEAHLWKIETILRLLFTILKKQISGDFRVLKFLGS